MQSDNLQDTEVSQLLRALTDNLAKFPEGSGRLDTECESAAKHIPAYVKIVKSHVEQLEQVLATDNHSHKTLETAELAHPVLQLIQLFKVLHDEDIQTFENLALTASHFTVEPDLSTATETTESEVDEASSY